MANAAEGSSLRGEEGSGPPSASHLRRAGLAALVLLHTALWALAGLSQTFTSDLDLFFFPSALKLADGHPLEMYAVRAEEVYPNANGPLSLLPLGLAALVCKALGITTALPLRNAVVMAIFSPFTLLMAREALLAADRIAGARLGGARRLGAWAFLLLTPLVRLALTEYGHVELFLGLWLVLWAMRRFLDGHEVSAGALLGLAVLARTGFSNYLLALLLVCLAQRRWRDAVRLGATAAALVVAGLAPLFALAFADTWYSLVAFRPHLPVLGGGVWGLALGTRLEGFARRFDGAAIQAVVAALSALSAWRRTLGPAELYRVGALVGLSFALFIRALWGYHLAEPFVFATVVWLGSRTTLSRARFWAGLALPVALTCAGYLAWSWEPQDEAHPMGFGRSLVLVALIGSVAAALAAGLRRREPEPAAGALPSGSAQA